MARLPDGTLGVGRALPGRGAWLCSRACLDRAERRRAFDRALRAPVVPGAVARLRRELERLPMCEDRGPVEGS